MQEIINLISLLALLVFFNSYSQAIGGAIWFSINVLIFIPYIGRVFRFLLYKTRIFIVLKLLTYIIGALGILIGLWLYYLIFGWPSGYYAFLIILFCSLFAIIQFLYTIYTHNFSNFFEEVLNMSSGAMKKVSGVDIEAMMESEPEIKWQLTFNNFIDIHIPLAFNALVNIGTTYYALCQLNIFSLKKNLIAYPTIFDCIKYAIALTPVVKVDNSEIPFEGLIWDATNSFFGLIVFIWSVVFLTVALDELSGQRDSGKDEAVLLRMNEIVHGFNLLVKYIQPILHKQQADTENKNTNEKTEPGVVESTQNRITETKLKEIIRAVNDVFLQLNSLAGKVRDLETQNKEIISRLATRVKREVKKKKD